MKDTFIVFLVISTGIYFINGWENKGIAEEAFNAGKESVKPGLAHTTKDTIRDTVYVPAAKPKPRPAQPKDSSIYLALADALSENDSLKQFVVSRMQPKEFFIADSMAHAVIFYDPIADEYSGYLVHATIESNTEQELLKPVKIPCPDVPPPEEWYEDGAIFVSGAATGIVVVASGGTPLLGLGVAVAIGGVMAIW